LSSHAPFLVSRALLDLVFRVYGVDSVFAVR
jgi:hypothetical protein